MRTPIIAGNWKMNTNIFEAEQLVAKILSGTDSIKGVEIVICPPFTHLDRLNNLPGIRSINVGAQNMHYMEKGAYTGEISPHMLTGLCNYVILGHSERRAYFHETNELINNKILSALKYGLKPILCVGETPEEKEKGLTEEIIELQLKEALKDVPSSSSTGNIVIAYEPVWAIGTGVAATGDQASSTVKFIRDVIGLVFNRELAKAIRIQYGGSVTPANINEFIQHSDIDGALVGGASLKADEFLAILNQTAEIKYK